MVAEFGKDRSTVGAPAQAAPRSGRRLQLLAFYVGVPLVIGTYGALNNWQLLQSAGYAWTLGFYAAHAFVPWWITSVLTYASMWVLKSIKPSPYVLMAIGSILAGFVVLPYTNWLTSLFGALWQDADLTEQIARVFSLEFWNYIVRATIVWFAVNFIFDRFLGLPRYRYVIPHGYESDERPAAGTVAQASRPPPAFAERIPAPLGSDDILAIKAEQHYIRVFSENREYMVLYRFSDAVRELDPRLGLQVHRSWWISKAAIDAVRPSAKKFTLRLTTGTTVPVSTPYHGVVKEFARVNQIPTR